MGEAGLGETVRLLVLTAALAAALAVTATASAESLKIKHRPWHTLSRQQKIVVLKKQIHKDKCVIRFWKHHRYLASTSYILALKSRTQTHWARVSMRIAGKSLHKLTASSAYSQAVGSDISAWMCIHRYEGAWNANTGNGYFGGLQMDMGFQRTYGSEFLHQYGTANNWPPSVQILVARRARDGYHGYSARGYGPWPNTARLCGLL